VFRTVTIAREYGSGGAAIARKVAKNLGWRLLDGNLVDSVSRVAQVEPETARRYDESIDSWWHRLNRAGLWAAAVWGGTDADEIRFFDAATMASFTEGVILRAANKGACVIVGRGAQCTLQNDPTAFHVFVCAPWRQRVARVRGRVPEGEHIEERIRSIDRIRAEYIRRYFGCNWKDPHLYHMMVSSDLGEEQVTDLIVGAVEGLDHSPVARSAVGVMQL